MTAKTNCSHSFLNNLLKFEVNRKKIIIFTSKIKTLKHGI